MDTMTPEQRCQLLMGNFDQQSGKCMFLNPPDQVLEPGESAEGRNRQRQYCMLSKNASSCMYDVHYFNVVRRTLDTSDHCWNSMSEWHTCWDSESH